MERLNASFRISGLELLTLKSAYFCRVFGHLIQQVWIGLDEPSSQVLQGDHSFLQDHGWLEMEPSF
jgi:hypothetical protein